MRRHPVSIPTPSFCIRMLRKRVNSRLAMLLASTGILLVAWAQNPPPRPQRDAVAEAQQPSLTAPKTRPEQQKSEHDESGVFIDLKAPASSPVLKTQPKEGKISG